MNTLIIAVIIIGLGLIANLAVGWLQDKKLDRTMLEFRTETVRIYNRLIQLEEGYIDVLDKLHEGDKNKS
jgi:hypothetical protein